MSDIVSRKSDHIQLCLEEDVSMGLPTGLAGYRFMHAALPELRPEDVSLETTFLGRRVAAPVLIGAMTGGPERGTAINRHLGEAAQALGLPMALGSQRVMLERPESARSFLAAREAAPDALILGNMGAVQLNYGVGVDDLRRLVEASRVDGLFLHLNPLQEMIQPGGDTDFRGLLAKIAHVARTLGVPVLVKEVGSGIAPGVARALAAAGVAAIDVSGAGGTSWSAIEAHRAGDPARRALGEVFRDWGIPTAVSLRLCREALPDFPLIASGGIRTGLEAAKAIALGADMVGLAMPLLEPATRSSEAVARALTRVMDELRLAMFLLGVTDVATLRRSRHLLMELP